jgi:hypothetical protein
MTDEEWSQIRPYAEAKAKAQAAFDAAQMVNTVTNTVTDDPRRRLEQDIWFDSIKLALAFASQDLETVKKRVLRGIPMRPV